MKCVKRVCNNVGQRKRKAFVYLAYEHIILRGIISAAYQVSLQFKLRLRVLYK